MSVSYEQFIAGQVITTVAGNMLSVPATPLRLKWVLDVMRLTNSDAHQTYNITLGTGSVLNPVFQGPVPPKSTVVIPGPVVLYASGTLVGIGDNGVSTQVTFEADGRIIM